MEEDRLMLHLAFPIRVTGSGALATVDKDSTADVVQSVGLLLDTRPGERRSVPEYGLPDPVFGGLNVTELAQLITEWEPRADLTTVEQLAQGVIDAARVNTGTAGPPDYEIDTTSSEDAEGA